MPTQKRESDEPSPIRAISLGSLIRWQSAVRRRSLRPRRPEDLPAAPRKSKSLTALSSRDSDALVNPSRPKKRRMHSYSRSRDAAKSATVLHAVPESTAFFATALLPTERDKSMQARQHVSNPSLNMQSPTSSSRHTTSPRSYRSSENNLASPKEDVKAVFNRSSLKGAIGVYKNGKIQWRQKEKSPEKENKNARPAEQKSRPKIRVVIPSNTRNRPLPALPFFPYPGRTHIVSASIGSDVSPPSANHKGVMRNSVVSPLSQPLSSGQPYRSMCRVRSTKQQKKTPTSSGSSRHSTDSDSASDYSAQSSHTSVDEIISSTEKKDRRILYMSVINPVAAGVFDSSPEEYTKHPVAPSVVPPRRYHHAETERDHVAQSTCSISPKRKFSGPLARRASIKQRSSKRSVRRRSLVTTQGAIDQAISRSTSRQSSLAVRVSSPTLSEAENDLAEQLTSFKQQSKPQVDRDDSSSTTVSESSPFEWDEIIESTQTSPEDGEPRMDSATFEAPPVIPRKSSKRQSAISPIARPSYNPKSPQLNRARSVRQRQGLSLAIPENARMTEVFELTPIDAPPKSARRIITPSCAEDVIFNIFRSLDHFNDLFATAVLNRGFYRVFKRHELELIKSTLRNMSPPAWEFREIAFPGHDMLHDEDLEMKRPVEEYTPATYLRAQKNDLNVIREIKALIREKCQSFVRPEISIALISDDAAEAGRVDDALWRIWTFCKIFGSGKGREDDIVAQQDWLKGGVMVHQQACTFSIMSTDYMNDTLVAAPECFAKGNEGGLSAEQLFDMMELWNCLAVLLQGFTGRTTQAREYGIYDCTDVRGGDIDGEEMMLDEWCSHILTHGLTPILTLATPSHHPTPIAFQLARQHSWTNWTPPVFGGTRRTFLKEAASRVYEDKIAHTYATTSTRDIQRQLSKQRIQRHISELRVRRTNGPRVPLVTMAEERPMSEWSTVIGSLTRGRPISSTAASNIVSHIPSYNSSSLTPGMAELPAARTPPPCRVRERSPPRRTVAQPLLPSPPPSTAPSTAPSTRDRSSVAMSMPAIEEHPAFRRKSNDVPAMPDISTHPAFRAQLPQLQTQFPPPPPRVYPHTPYPQYQPQPQPHHMHHTRHPPRQHTQSHVRQTSSESSASSTDHPVFQQHPAQRDIYASQAHENTAEKAIYRIVEMGFTPEQAREALRMTDLGDGLRVDRAVELLLTRAG